MSLAARPEPSVRFGHIKSRSAVLEKVILEEMRRDYFHCRLAIVCEKLLQTAAMLKKAASKLYLVQ